MLRQKKKKKKKRWFSKKTYNLNSFSSEIVTVGRSYDGFWFNNNIVITSLYQLNAAKVAVLSR